MSRICYCVIATLPSAAVADEYVSWLQGGHIQQVCEGGAASAIVVRLDADGGPTRRVMTRYEFPSREAFDRYVAVHAPALREDGLRRFPPERGVIWQRMVGEIVAGPSG